MKLTSSFAALSSVVVIALCLGQAQADTVTTPLGLTQVDDKGVPITPLTYLNLAPASKELSGAAKKITTPPPMLHEKRLAPSDADHLQPLIEEFTSKGISIRSLLPALPIIGQLDNEGDHTNALPPAAQKRLLDALKALEPSDTTQYLPENHQTLGQRTPHPLNRRADDSLDLNLFGEKVPNVLPAKLPAKLPGSKRDGSSGLNLLGSDIPLDALKLPGSKRETQTPPVDLGLKSGDAENLAAVQKILNGVVGSTKRQAIEAPAQGSGLAIGNEQDMERAQKFLAGLLAGGKRELVEAPAQGSGLTIGNEQDMERAQKFLSGLLAGGKREAIEAPTEGSGLTLGNEQDMERAQKFLAGLLAGGKRDTISPDNVDLGSLKGVGEGAAKAALPIAVFPIKQTASPAVQGIKAVNALCTSFGCHQAAQGAVKGVTKDLPVPLPAARALGDKDPFANGLLDNQGAVAGVPVKRAQDPLTATVLDTSDSARDAILNLKDGADNAAGAFVKNMYSKHGQVETKRALNFPGYSLLPGTGPKAKEAVQEAYDFIGIPIPGVPMSKRMEKVRRRE